MTRLIYKAQNRHRRMVTRRIREEIQARAGHGQRPDRPNTDRTPTERPAGRGQIGRVNS